LNGWSRETRNVLAADYRAMDESEWEVLRARMEFHAGARTHAEIIPPEANLQARAIDTKKAATSGRK